MERSMTIPANFNDEIDEQLVVLTKEQDALYTSYYDQASPEGLLLNLLETDVEQKIKGLQVSK